MNFDKFFECWYTFLNEKFDSFHACKTTVKKFRSSGWEKLQKIGLPLTSTPGYSAIPFRHIYSILPHIMRSEPSDGYLREMIDELTIKECQQRRIVLVDGHFRRDLSTLSGINPEILLLTMEDALLQYAPLFQAWSKLSAEEDPFVELNRALFEGGLYIYIPPKTISPQIQIIQITSAFPAEPVFSRLHIYAGAHSTLPIMMWQGELKTGTLQGITFSHTEALLEENAQLEIYQMQATAFSSVMLQSVRVHQKHASIAKFVMAHAASPLWRSDFQATLQESNSRLDLHVLGAVQEKNQTYLNTRITHVAPSTESNQTIYHLLSDNSRASFEGKIYIHPEAQQTRAYQLNKNILLSDYAIVSSQPSLEIFADDVKASHGATVGALDPEMLNYLTARGIAPEVAKELLLEGYYQHILALFPNQEGIRAWKR